VSATTVRQLFISYQLGGSEYYISIQVITIVQAGMAEDSPLSDAAIQLYVSAEKSDPSTSASLNASLLDSEAAQDLLQGEVTPANCCAPATISYATTMRLSKYRFIADAPYVLTGFRHDNTLLEAALSIFKVHNETCNIATHLIGAVVILGLLIFVAAFDGAYTLGRAIVPLYPPAAVPLNMTDVDSSLAALEDGIVSTPLTLWPVLLFLSSALACLVFSTVFHVFMSTNQLLFDVLLKFDYLGIAVLVTGSSAALPYYAFYCHPVVFVPYNTVMAVAFVIVVILSLWKKFASVEYNSFRFASYVVLGLVCSIPMFHIALTVQLRDEHVKTIYGVLAGSLIQYLVGGSIYSARVPEKWFPGKFDYFFASHSIMHTFIVTASITHAFVVCAYFVWRDAHMSCAVDDTVPIWE
jgi:adiponectin receptor